MTWFQLLERDEPKTQLLTGQPPVRLVPNSAFFLNPALLTRPQVEPARTRPQLRLLRWGQ